MNTDNQSTPSRDIPVPPSGGSWVFDEIAWEWVSNDPQPQVEATTVETHFENLNTEQEQ